MIKKYMRCADSVIIVGAIIYVILPIIVFISGWIKPLIALPLIVLFIFAGFKLWTELRDDSIALINKDTSAFWILTTALAFIWVYFSGIGSFVYQNWDFWARNPFFRDLATYKWPVYYDLSTQSDVVQKICGTEKVTLIYYFCWWLPVAGLANVLQLGEVSRNCLLALWAAIGVFDVFYLLCRKLNKCSWKIPVCFMMFSGLDGLAELLLRGGETQFIDHIEWWAEFFQYSCNTTLIFWVFNQAIPVWILMALFLQLKSNKNIGTLLALSFAYSPWAALGVFPIAAVASLKKGKIKSILNPANLLIPCAMLVVFGCFYLGWSGPKGNVGLLFSFNAADNWRILFCYLIFILVEVLVYFFILGKYAMQKELYGIVLFELVIIPLIVVHDCNFVMRGSIPALFILYFYVISFLLDYEADKKPEWKMRYIALVAALIIGSLTPMHEIARTVKNTMTNDDFLYDPVVSFGNVQTDDEYLIDLAKQLSYGYNYEENLFFKYLAK
ncbi:MAG: hypothetical protein IKO76_02345 [Butyrivibrio sp.]|nr:hypothetical protein [Butyrivibrio sp.]